MQRGEGRRQGRVATSGGPYGLDDGRDRDETGDSIWQSHRARVRCETVRIAAQGRGHGDDAGGSSSNNVVLILVRFFGAHDANVVVVALSAIKLKTILLLHTQDRSRFLLRVAATHQNLEPVLVSVRARQQLSRSSSTSWMCMLASELQ